LLLAGYTRQEPDEFNAIKVTERGRGVLFKREPVSLPAWGGLLAGTRRRATVQAHVGDAALFDELRAVRKRLADANHLPPYAILHDSALRAMAATQPRTRTDLLRIPGIGERKAEAWGDAFLACIGGSGRERPAATAMLTPGSQESGRAGARSARGGALSPTAQRSLDLFREGISMSDIAATRGLATTTIEGHLADAIESGDLALEGLVDSERQHAIERAIEAVGADLLAPIREHVGEDYSYAEIRFVRAAVWHRRSSYAARPAETSNGVRNESMQVDAEFDAIEGERDIEQSTRDRRI
jgi:ATP-dependent DNA helicase RecQ